MANILHLQVDNPDEILNSGAYGAGALLQIQSATAEAGPFADLSGTGSTPTIPIVSGTKAYTGYDPAGTTATWYRTRYKSADALRLSDWSAAFLVGAAEGFLVSLADVKGKLGITSTTDDEQLLDYLGEVTDDFSEYTGRRFVRSPASGSATFLFDVEQPSRTLWVPEGLAAVSQVEVATQTGGAYAVLATSDWFLDPPDPAPGWTYLSVSLSDVGSTPMFYAGKRTVRLTGAKGWAEVPRHISRLAERAVIRRWQNRKSAATGQRGEGTDIGSRWNLTIEEARLLDRYRYIPV
jgi:hypothetical protein